MVKERNEAGLKKNSTAVHKFLEELVKIGEIFIAFLYTYLKKATQISLLLKTNLVKYQLYLLTLILSERPTKYFSDFPGSKPVSEASSKFGPALVSGPVFFVFEKVSTFIVTEEKVEKVEAVTELSP